MVAVHALVAEVLAYLVDTLETAYDETLQVELSGDTHVHVLIQGIEVGDERTGRGTAGNHLKGGGLYFGVTSIIQHFAERPDDGCTLQEGILHALVHHEVDIALTVAQLRVIELVVGHAVLILHDGQGLQALAQQSQFLGVDTDFSRLGAEHLTLDTNKVADVEQALEYIII